MDNTNIEIQPTVRVESPVFPEVPVEPGSLEAPVANSIEKEPNKVETSFTKIDDPVGLDIDVQVPKPSAGFQIDPKSTGASKAVLEKLLNKLENL